FHVDEIFAGRYQRTFAAGVVDRLDLLELHADQLAVVDDEFLRYVVIEYRDALALGVFDFPRRRLHVGARRTHGDSHAFAAETQRGAAAVHRGVAAAEDDDFPADLFDMAEGDTGQPVDADMDIGLAFFAAGQFQVAAARRAGADEHGVV